MSFFGRRKVFVEVYVFRFYSIDNLSKQSRLSMNMGNDTLGILLFKESSVC